MQQKKQHWSQRLQLCLYNWHYLLTFFCFSSVQKQSLPARREQEGSPSLIPAAWNEAGHADARSSLAEAQILLQQQDTRIMLLHGSVTPPDARGRAAGGCTPPQEKNPTFSVRNSPSSHGWEVGCAAKPFSLGRAQHGTPSRLALATALRWLQTENPREGRWKPGAAPALPARPHDSAANSRTGKLRAPCDGRGDMATTAAITVAVTWHKSILLNQRAALKPWKMCAPLQSGPLQSFSQWVRPLQLFPLAPWPRTDHLSLNFLN